MTRAHSIAICLAVLATTRCGGEDFGDDSEEEDAGADGGGSSDLVQVVWRNGSLGVWNDDPKTGALELAVDSETVAYESADVTDDLTGGTPSLQIRYADDAKGSHCLYVEIATEQDGTAFAEGNLEFDVARVLYAENIAWIRVFDGELAPGAISIERFTHISLPLSGLGSSRPGGTFDLGAVRDVFDLCFAPDDHPVGQPMLLLNDIKWTE